MNSFARHLVNALTMVPAPMFDAIKATIDGDQTIAWGTFTTVDDDGKSCGCLIFDGMAQRDHHLFEELGSWVSDPAVVFSPSLFVDLGDKLASFYGVDLDAHRTSNVIIAYDEWATHRHAEENGGIWDDVIGTGPVRDELRDIAARAADIRARAAAQ